VYFGWPPLCMLASQQVKQFLAKKTFGNSCVYVMSTLCNILLLIFLFMSDGSESSNYWNWSCSKIILSRHLDSYLAFSPWICLWVLLILVSKKIERFNYFDLPNFSSFCIWNLSNNSHPWMELQNIFSR
jgi:hypothetical protein